MMPFEWLRESGRSGLVVFCDVDGTLLSEDNVLHRPVEQAIRQFIQQGHGFSLATGRSLSGVERLLCRIPVTEPVVLCNGALIYDPVTGRRDVFPLPYHTVQCILPHLLSIPDIRLYLECADGSLCVSDSGALSESFVIEEKMKPIVFHRCTDLGEDIQILKIGVKLLHPDPEKRTETTERLSDLLKKHTDTTHFCFSAPTYGEILATKVSKWSGIQTSLQKHKAADRVVCTVGDQQNDFEMILNAEIGIAMGNSIDELKRIADFSIGRVEEAAVASLLRELASCWETSMPCHSLGTLLRTRMLGHA